MATKLTGLVKNIRMYDASNSSVLRDSKSIAELTYFYVPADDSDMSCDVFYVFSDEQAAEMFAGRVNSRVYCDYELVCIPR